jgi:ribosomal protein L35
MPKLKSHSGTKKRAYRTGSGKWALKRNSRNHLLMQKHKRQKRLNRTLLVHPSDAGKFVALLPNA